MIKYIMHNYGIFIAASSPVQNFLFKETAKAPTRKNSSVDWYSDLIDLHQCMEIVDALQVWTPTSMISCFSNHTTFSGKCGNNYKFDNFGIVLSFILHNNYNI